MRSRDIRAPNLGELFTAGQTLRQDVIDTTQPGQPSVSISRVTSGNTALTPEIAATTSRVFLGVQIQCAECHNAKSEPRWKREQFHSFAAFFGRARLIQHKDVLGRGTPYAIEGRDEGQYHITDKKDPRLLIPMQPRFLTGESVPLGKFVSAFNSSGGWAITPDGQQIFGSSTIARSSNGSFDSRPYKWTPAAGMVQLPIIAGDPEDSTFANIFACTPDGPWHISQFTPGSLNSALSSVESSNLRKRNWLVWQAAQLRW